MHMPFYPNLDLTIPLFWKIASEVKKSPPNIIHISTPGPVGMVGYILASRLGIPKIGTYHTNFPAYLYANTGSRVVERLAKRAMHRFYSGFAKILVRSEVYRDILVNEIRIDEAKIHVLLPGTDTDIFHKRYRNIAIWEKYGIEADSLKALYVGRMTDEKKFPFLLEVWERFWQSHPKAKIDLVIVGEGKYKKSAQRLCSKRVHVLGNRFGAELSQIYASCDFFLFPSETETLGQVIMEAQASGLPVVVSDKGGHLMLVNRDNEETAIVVSSDDKAAWQKAIEVLAFDSKLRQRMAEAAHHSMQRLSIRDSFNDFWRVHEEMFRQMPRR